MFNLEVLTNCGQNFRFTVDNLRQGFVKGEDTPNTLYFRSTSDTHHYSLQVTKSKVNLYTNNFNGVRNSYYGVKVL